MRSRGRLGRGPPDPPFSPAPPQPSLRTSTTSKPSAILTPDLDDLAVRVLGGFSPAGGRPSVPKMLVTRQPCGRPDDAPGHHRPGCG
jgi:hypothetical protein